MWNIFHHNISFDDYVDFQTINLELRILDYKIICISNVILCHVVNRLDIHLLMS